MRPRRLLGLLAIFVFVPVVAPLTSCTRSESPSSASRGDAKSELKAGAPLLSFRPEEISELTFWQNNPHQDSRWTGQFKKEADGHWSVVALSQDFSPLDRRADSSLIHHFLDTLTTFQVLESLGEGASEKFGLSPAFFRIELRDSSNRLLSLSLGEAPPPSSGKSGVYAQAQMGSERTPVVLGKGAALAMLQYLRTPEALRQRVLLTVTTDEVDELTLLRQGQPILKAERQGDDWIDARKKKLKAPVTPYLEKLTHLRAAEFADDPAQAKRALQALQAKRPLFTARLTDRHGQQVELHATPWEGALWASVSSRPEGAFKLYPESIQLFKPPFTAPGR